MPDLLKIFKKIPDREDFVTDGETKVVVNSVLGVVRFSIFQFRCSDQTCDARILDWLFSLDFSLQDWNDARKLLDDFTSVRKSKFRAIQDCVENFKFDTNFVINSAQLSIIPGMNKSLMLMPPIEQGIKLAKDKIEGQFSTKTNPPQNVKVVKIPPLKNRAVNASVNNLTTKSTLPSYKEKLTSTSSHSV